MHIPVLPKEVIEELALKEGDVVLDGTVGMGGHSREICKVIGKTGKLIGLDQDLKALNIAEETLQECVSGISLVKENFRYLEKVLKSLNIKEVDKVLFDLGFSSMQMDDSGRGFSFLTEGPLLMTLNDSPHRDAMTASTIVNDWDEENIADVIFAYGEEQFARRIASEIVETRKGGLISTTSQLVAIIEKSVPGWYKHKKTHFATKTFQALRITVNDELGALKEGLEKAFLHLSSGGRIAVISFHSLEDRIVKNFFRDQKKANLAKVITKRPITASREETKTNPRSRSAKLRILEKI